MLAAMQERTHYRPTADGALMRWNVRHTAWLIPRFLGGDVQSPVLSCHGRTVSRKTGGLWRNSSCTSSRGWKGIWTSPTEVGRQTEIWRVAGKERPHGRALCPNRWWSCICAKCTTTRRAQLVRREPLVNHRDPTEAEVDDNR